MKEHPLIYSKYERTMADKHGPIIATFNITDMPEGAASESIRKNWIGTKLPVRQGLLEEVSGKQLFLDRLRLELVHNDEPIPVFGADAIVALRGLDRTVAASYWLDRKANYLPLVFRASEGIITPQ